MKFFHQLESVDCGPACLAMISSHYKRNYSLRQVKTICDVTRMGVAVKDIISGARKMGFESNGAKMTVEELEIAPLPLVLYWKQTHFVVLYKVVRRNDKLIFYIADPSYGKIKIDAEILTKEWMGANTKGISILMRPIEGVCENPPKEQKTRFYKEELVKDLLRFVGRNKWKYILSALMLILGLATNWAIPILFKKTIDSAVGGKSLHIVWVLLLAQLMLFLGNFVFRLFSDLVLTKLNFNLSILLKENFLQKIMKLPIRYFDTRINASTLQRLNDQDKIRSFMVWKGHEMILTLINLVAFSIILYTMNKYIFIVFFLGSVLSIFWMSVFLKKRNIVTYSTILRQTENSNSLYEFVMNMPEIKINGAQNKMIANLADIQKKLHSLELRSLYLNMSQNLGVSFLSKFKELLSLAVCCFLILKGQLTVGSVLGISYILGQLNHPIISLISYFNNAQDADISRKRVNDVYLEKEENDTRKELLPENINCIEVRDVSFKYPGSFNHAVLENISFDIPKNKVTAIVGASGSGKTTLLKLLLSYYDPVEGSISIDTKPLSEINSDLWRDKCGTVLQDGHIFAGTIAENIALADPDFDREKVVFAAKIACLDEFISKLPMAYNTKVGSIGTQLSGGQKQRILIARAVYKNPDFLFFDEATSSLDSKNEKMIMSNLNQFFEGRTVVIIAHRLSTVKNADQIIVLDKGKIVEQGNHMDLVENKGDYFELVRNQLELGV
jgi:ATP-binding cassette, subfamily B, bacterial